jgi:hypothetical protein
MRKTKLVRIDSADRDQGKVFLIKEMSAFQAEKWAQRAFLALARSGVDIEQSVKDAGVAGLAGLAVSGLRALTGLSFDEAEPLLDEMLGCVRVVPDPKEPDFTRALMMGTPDGEGDDIQEIMTLVRLRREIIELHIGFFVKGAPQTSTSGTSSVPHPSSTTQTSRDQSAA